MDFQPNSIGKPIVWLDAAKRIYNHRFQYVGLEDLTGNGNHMYWNKPQEKLEAFFRRIVRWLDKYIWREPNGFAGTHYVLLSDAQINEIGNGLADRFNVNWTDIK